MEFIDNIISRIKKHAEEGGYDEIVTEKVYVIRDGKRYQIFKRLHLIKLRCNPRAYQKQISLTKFGRTYAERLLSGPKFEIGSSFYRVKNSYLSYIDDLEIDKEVWSESKYKYIYENEWNGVEFVTHESVDDFFKYAGYETPYSKRKKR